jgi:hypothetical protein
MSAIQGLTSSNLRQILRQQSVSSGTVNSGNSTNVQSRQDPLSSVLASSGLSADDQASLKSDLKSALDKVFSSSSSFPPDAKDVQSAVKEVFSKYGLDADQLASKLDPSGDSKSAGGKMPGGRCHGGGPPPGMGGPPPSSGSSEDSSSSSSTSDSSDTTETLLEALKQFISQLSQQNSSQNTTDYLVTGLVGFNAQA